MHWISFKESNTEYLLCSETGAYYSLGDTDNAIHYRNGRTELANTLENHDQAKETFDALVERIEGMED